MFYEVAAKCSQHGTEVDISKLATETFKPEIAME